MVSRSMVLSLAQIWGEKYSMPASNRLPPPAQFCQRMWGKLDAVHQLVDAQHIAVEEPALGDWALATSVMWRLQSHFM